MTNELELSTRYIPHLATQFSRGNAVLFTGAGFSLEAVNLDGKPLPSARDLTRLLWDVCYPGEEFDRNSQLQDVFENVLQSDRRACEWTLRDRFTVDVAQLPEYYSLRLFARVKEARYLFFIYFYAITATNSPITLNSPADSESNTKSSYPSTLESGLNTILLCRQSSP